MFESSRANGLQVVNMILKWKLIIEKGIGVDVYEEFLMGKIIIS